MGNNNNNNNSAICKRAFYRNCCETSISYSVFDQKRDYDAKMYNNSEGGMYFESEHNIPPGSDICIKVTGISPEHGATLSKDYRGEVMWCRKVQRNGDSFYGVGVRFMVNTCDKCGEKIGYTEIQRTDNFLFLCPECLKDMEIWSGGKINDSLEKYLMGNVV